MAPHFPEREKQVPWEAMGWGWVFTIFSFRLFEFEVPLRDRGVGVRSPELGIQIGKLLVGGGTS